MDTVHTAITEPVRRLEVFTGAGHGAIKTRPELSPRSRRAKTRSVRQLDAMDYRRSSCLAGDVKLRESEAGRSEADALQFVPAVVDVGSSPVEQRKAPDSEAEASAGTIEVEIDGVTVRVARGADAKTLMAVLRALKAGT